MSPPNCGCGWVSTAAATGASGVAISAWSDRSSAVTTRRSLPTGRDGTVATMTSEEPNAPAKRAGRRRPRTEATDEQEKLPISMLYDRILVRLGAAEGERRSSGGILIPATAQMSKR